MVLHALKIQWTNYVLSPVWHPST